MKNIIFALFCAVIIASCSTKNETVTLLVKFTVKPEKMQEFKKATVNSLNHSLEEDGNIAMKLYTDDNNPTIIYVYSHWKNKEAYKIHGEKPYSKELHKVVKESLSEEPTIMVLGNTKPFPIASKKLNTEDKEETLFFIFKTKDGYRDQVIKQFEKHITNTRKEKGNLFFDLYTVEGDENTFVVYENWRNASAIWDIHMNSPYAKETGALLNEAIVGKLEAGMNFVSELNSEVLNTTYSAEKQWEILGNSMPESIFASPNHEWLYVSNVNQKGKVGYLSKVSKAGKVVEEKWIDGLSGPCGSDMYEGKLYVADQKFVRIIDVEKGEVIKSIQSETAISLNDVSITKNGQVFISDVPGGKIYTIKNDKLKIWLDTPEIHHSNGILVQGENLIVVDFGSEMNPQSPTFVSGSVYKVNIETKAIKTMPSGHQLGVLDGVVAYKNGLLVSDPMAKKVYYLTDNERTLLKSFPFGPADINIDGDNLYLPYIFGDKIASYKIVKDKVSTKKTVFLKKGNVGVVDLGNVKIHTYQTKDLMNDVVIVLEKDDKAILLESPAFWDNIDEFRGYLKSNVINVEGMLVPYHPLGATFIDDDNLDGVAVYSSQNVLDYWEKGFGAVMKQGIPKAFGDKIDAKFYKPTQLVKEGTIEVAGFKLETSKSFDGFDILIPEIKTAYVHILGHDVHSEILGQKHLDSSIENFQKYIDQGYTTFLSSHYAPETLEDAKIKVAYLKEMHKIVSKSKSANEFVKNMKTAYPTYKEGYLKATTNQFFPVKK